MQARGEAVRQRFNAFVDRHEVAWELVMAALAAAYVAIGFAADDARPGVASTVEAADGALTAIFVMEFSSRLWASPRRPDYLRGHWIDLLAIIPTVRGVRLLRLLRLLRLIRMFAGLYRGLMHYERLARHRGLLGLFVAWLGVAGICAAALFLAESGVNPNIREPVDAMWWGVVTLTTVGYGDIYPVTPEGRLAAGALMILGITLFATITGTIASALINARDDAATMAGELERLARLHSNGKLTDDEFERSKRRILA